MNENEIIEMLKGLRAGKAELESEKAEIEIELLGINSAIFRLEKKMPSSSKVQPVTLPNPVPLSIPESPYTSPDSQETTGSLFNEEKFSDFPKTESRDNQFLYLLTKSNRATRLVDLLKLYNSLVAHNKKISKHQARTSFHRLKRDGTLVVAQYNNANQLQFYAFPNWVETNEDGFKNIIEEFRPSDDELINGFRNIEFL